MRRLAALALALALAILVAISAAFRASPATPLSSPRADALAAREAPIALSPAAPVPLLPPADPAPTPPAVRSAARPIPRAPTDPCAPEDDAEGASRPSISELVDARVSELVARARALDDHASEPLREGLTLLTRDPERALALLERAPDREDRGFDHAAGAALLLGARALSEARAGDALRWARRASLLAPRDPTGPILEATVAAHHDDRLAVRDALGRAFARDPEDPAIGWALGARLARSEHLEDALQALDVYLASAEGDLAARRLRARTARQAESARGSVRRARHGIVLLAPPTLDAEVAERALLSIDEALGDAARWTRTERAAELLVLVHRDAASMRAATCTPAWSGAVFDGLLHTDAETLRGPPDDVRVVLRHESLHAQLHLRPGGDRVVLPYWLDEGMAAEFSGERTDGARRSWAMLARERTWIPFASIEGAFVDIDDSRDAGLAYHQSLAMVRYLVARSGPRVIADAIAAADRGVSPSALLGEVAPELDGARLLGHVENELAASD